VEEITKGGTMPEKAVNQQLNTAKSTACKILIDAGYKIERANNQTFCLTAGRNSEWRVIAVGTRPIIKCPWFIEQVKRLEKYPCPDSNVIQKEVWIRGEGEHTFRQFVWKNSQWFDENLEPADIFN
jgi:hypothetical protein